MTTNILKAIKTVVENDISDVVSFYKSKNRINSAGDALELFVKDIFADTVSESDINKKHAIYENYFSYFGNASNPPDLMIIKSDNFSIKAVKIKSPDNPVKLIPAKLITYQT